MSVVEKPWGRLVVNEMTGETVPIIDNRVEYVRDEDFSLDPGSMVGSWFLVLVEREIIWLGAVVAEPQAGKYLVNLEKLEDWAPNVQRLFTLDTMMGLGDEARRLIEGAVGESKAPVVDPSIEWRFYDSQEKAQAAYVGWVSRDQVRVED